MSSESHNDAMKWSSLAVHGNDDDLEDVYGYKPGGYHPVHIDDDLDSGRYRVLHKFGYGGSSTVWLCRDTSYNTPTYVAVKIIAAELTEESCHELDMDRHMRELGVDRQPEAHLLCFPLRDFRQTGPNGTHICIVYPVLGPPLHLAMETFKDKFSQDDCARIVRGLVRQVASGIALLHANGICHGDLRPPNVLLRLESLEGLTTSEVYDIVGEPEAAEVVAKDSSGAPVLVPGIPQYLVYPIERVKPDHLSRQISITDFGEAFNHSTEGERLTGIPRPYSAPELVFDKKGGLAADLWALACLAFETRLGGKIIEPCDIMGPDDTEYLLAVILFLGRLPDKWWDTWDTRDEFIARSNGGTHSRLELRVENWGEREEERSIDEKARGQCRYDGELWDISQSEVEVMSKLLEQLLQYEPEKRLAAQDAVNHEWFRM
ncbi:Serine threonine-kinase SKY1 [Cordyceps militaris]|uniref:non-specific serine/threonine protein kinase n=1 Tax=Cordyceps militaris TaxID=73501 RepID=A0A2H4SD13_CORMI|nr:Serine threonine-kinase SKY1 [Cordyceps militaris]